MCNHDWETISDVADGSGDRYCEDVCKLCGDSREYIVDDMG